MLAKHNGCAFRQASLYSKLPFAVMLLPKAIRKPMSFSALYPHFADRRSYSLRQMYKCEELSLVVGGEYS